MSTKENDIYMENLQERIETLEKEFHHIRINGIVYNAILRDKALIRELGLQPTVNNVLTYWYEKAHNNKPIINREIYGQ